MAKKSRRKAERLPSLKSWAQRMGVDIHIAEAYQRARRNWQNRVSAFARKFGGVKSKEIPADIRTIAKMYGQDFEQFIEYRTSEIKFRSRNATEYLSKRQDTYISNLMQRMAESPALENDGIVDEMQSFFANATREEKSRFIAEIGGQALEVLGYVEDETVVNGRKRKVQRDVLDYDFSPVIKAFRRITE